MSMETFWLIPERAFVFCLTLGGAFSMEFPTFHAVHPGLKYDAVSVETWEVSQVMCSIRCVLQHPTCSAFNYRETDGSCQLVTGGLSDLVDDGGFKAFAQMHCLRDHPMIYGAKAVYEHGWNGEYPAPKGAMVSLVCENPQGFVDGSKLATCAIERADIWYTSKPFYRLYCKGTPLERVLAGMRKSAGRGGADARERTARIAMSPSPFLPMPSNWHVEPKDQKPKDQEPKDQEVKDQEVKDQEVKDQEVKDQEVKDQEVKDQEVKDQEVKDQEVKDQEVKDQEVKRQTEACSLRPFGCESMTVMRYTWPCQESDGCSSNHREVYTIWPDRVDPLGEIHDVTGDDSQELIESILALWTGKENREQIRKAGEPGGEKQGGDGVLEGVHGF
ncbi:unnamed protein product [Darwinula stevensoni]|uniref:Apple domain-containing protein n=1 Tax=Darwinula stevensoni TaxID=69355 RepID=A0A7R9A654_9CRUS|nr:unnamed protein product [Darwinula stevensoni]CAG0888061.1 unnamed protein product [Darwinula stevensoni]